MEVWTCYEPVKVKIFAFLVLRRRILTHDLMLERGMMCDELRCLLCSCSMLETTLHLMFYCEYSTRVWEQVQIRIGQTLLIRSNSVTQTWFLSSTTYAGGAKGKRFIAVLWHMCGNNGMRQFSEVL